MAIVQLAGLVLIVQIALRGSRMLSTLFAVDLGAGPWVAGVLFALHGFFPCLLAIAAGRIADRFDNRRLMIAGTGSFAGALALPFLWPSLATLYVTVALGGLTTLFYVLAVQNLFGVLSTHATRTRNFSYYAVAESTAAAIGPVVVGLCIDSIGHAPTYLALAVYTLACTLVVVAAARHLPSGTRAAAGEQAPRAMGNLLRVPAIRHALVTNGIVMAGIDLYQLYMPVYTHGLGMSATVIGSIVGAFGIAAFVSRLAIGPVTSRWGERRMLAVALAISALAYTGIPFTQSAPALALISFALGLGLGCGQPLSMAIAYNAAPPGRTAEAIAMRLAVSYGAHLVIPPAFGAVGTVLGLGPIFWTCSALLTSGAWINRRK